VAPWCITFILNKFYLNNLLRFTKQRALLDCYYKLLYCNLQIDFAAKFCFLCGSYRYASLSYRFLLLFCRSRSARIYYHTIRIQITVKLLQIEQ